MRNEKHNATLKAKAKEATAASAAAKGSSKKHPASGNSGELRVPKKARPSKFCQHCKAKGGPTSLTIPRNAVGMTEMGIPFLFLR
jgi:hypothetical protein